MRNFFLAFAAVEALIAAGADIHARIDSGFTPFLFAVREGKIGEVKAFVEAGVDGTPHVVNREPVAFVREEWRVVDRWWTEEPLDRRYYEVVLESGQNVCVYRDRERGCWFTQRA